MEINVLGFGLMGKQIAALFYLGGYDVYLWNQTDIDEKEFYRQGKILKKSFKKDNDGTFKFISKLTDLPNAVTIESIVEDIKAKKIVYEELKHLTKPYFTNSSSFSPSEIGDDVGGFHFFNPINIGLLELYLADNTEKESIDNFLEYLKGIEFEIVEVKSNRGYVGNFILFHEISSVFKLIEKYDYTVDQVNNVYRRLYGGRDIFSIVDLIGIDVTLNILTNLREEDESIYIPLCMSAAISKNILGRKNKTTITELI